MTRPASIILGVIILILRAMTYTYQIKLCGHIAMSLILSPIEVGAYLMRPLINVTTLISWEATGKRGGFALGKNMRR